MRLCISLSIFSEQVMSASRPREKNAQKEHFLKTKITVLWIWSSFKQKQQKQLDIGDPKQQFNLLAWLSGGLVSKLPWLNSEWLIDCLIDLLTSCYILLSYTSTLEQSQHWMSKRKMSYLTKLLYSDYLNDCPFLYLGSFKNISTYDFQFKDVFILGTISYFIFTS